MPNTKTIELTGSETKVRFDANYPYFWAINLGDGDVYMSTSPNIVPDADGVILIPAGEGRSTGDVGQANTLYFLGRGKVEISPQHNAVCPFFKPAGKGGESAEIDLSGYLQKGAVTNSSTLSMDGDTVVADRVRGFYLGDFYQSSVYNIKTSILSWWIAKVTSTAPQHLTAISPTCYFFASSDLAEHICDENYMFRGNGGGAVWQLTPIGGYNWLYGGICYGSFLLTRYDRPLYILTLERGYFTSVAQITTTADLTKFLPSTTSMLTSQSNTDVPTSKAVSDYVNDRFSYKTEEQTVGTWTDGKPLYQKTIFTVLTKENKQYINHSIENVETIWLDNSATFMVNPQTFATTPFMSTGIDTDGAFVNTNLAWIQSVDKQSISIRQGNLSGVTQAYITLKYTKTTD